MLKKKQREKLESDTRWVDVRKKKIMWELDLLVQPERACSVWNWRDWHAQLAIVLLNTEIA